MLNKALLPTPLCAIEFKLTLDSWEIPARMVINASGTPSKYVVFDGSALSPGQIKNLDATHAPIYCKINIHDVRFLEEINQ